MKNGQGFPFFLDIELCTRSLRLISVSKFEYWVLAAESWILEYCVS